LAAKVTSISVLHEAYNGDAALVAEIIALVLRDSQENYDQIRGLLEQKAWRDVKNLAHKIKNAYGIVGAWELQETLRLIEVSCTGDEVDEESIRAYVRKACGMILMANDELKSELQHL